MHYNPSKIKCNSSRGVRGEATFSLQTVRPAVGCVLMEPKSGFHPENVDVCCTKQSDEQAENVHSVMVKQEKRNQGQVWSLFLFSFVYLVYI